MHTSQKNLDSIKFLGICILLASIILAYALIQQGKNGRYQFQYSGHLYKLDTVTGEITQQ